MFVLLVTFVYNSAGYMNLSDGPIFSGSRLPSISDDKGGIGCGSTSSASKVKDTPTVATTTTTTATTQSSTTPKCWKTVYYLLDLYATMPETKTVTHRYVYAMFE